MKRNNNSLYPYPSLMQEHDFDKAVVGLSADVIECLYSETDPKQFVWTADIQSDVWKNDAEIQRLLKEGVLNYVLELDCPSTFFNDTARSCSLPISLSVGKDQLNNQCELTFSLVFTQDYKRFSHPALNPLFGNDVNYRAGDILGLFTHRRYELSISEEELDDNASIIRIEPCEDIESVEFDFSGDKILIKVPNSHYDGTFLGKGSYSYGTFDRATESDRIRTFIQFPLVMSAIIGALDFVKSHENDDEDDQISRWQRVLNELADNNGLRFPGDSTEERLANAFILKQAVFDEYLREVDKTYAALDAADNDEN